MATMQMVYTFVQNYAHMHHHCQETHNVQYCNKLKYILIA